MRTRYRQPVLTGVILLQPIKQAAVPIIVQNCANYRASLQFKALWEFKGEWRRGEQVMLRAKLNSTKPSDVFKAARYEGPRHAYQTLVDTQEREGLYAMPCAAKR